jgi:hypothetical protein
MEEQIYRSFSKEGLQGNSEIIQKMQYIKYRWDYHIISTQSFLQRQISNKQNFAFYTIYNMENETVQIQK